MPDRCRRTAVIYQYMHAGASQLPASTCMKEQQHRTCDLHNLGHATASGRKSPPNLNAAPQPRTAKPAAHNKAGTAEASGQGRVPWTAKEVLRLVQIVRPPAFCRAAAA